MEFAGNAPYIGGLFILQVKLIQSKRGWNSANKTDL
jgi:hypothetical protein